jgi:hypothetical protein
MSDKKKADLKELLEKLVDKFSGLKKYSLIIFVVFVSVLYGFLLLRIDTLSNAQPSADSVSGQVKAASIPKISQTLVNQLKSLQDNSVNVKTLFNQARNNPFQE